MIKLFGECHLWFISSPAATQDCNGSLDAFPRSSPDLFLRNSQNTGHPTLPDVTLHLPTQNSWKNDKENLPRAKNIYAPMQKTLPGLERINSFHCTAYPTEIAQYHRRAMSYIPLAQET